jgi:hypothetical protein
MMVVEYFLKEFNKKPYASIDAEAEFSPFRKNVQSRKSRSNASCNWDKK